MTGCLLLLKTGQAVIVRGLSVSRAKFLRKGKQPIEAGNAEQSFIVQSREIERVLPLPSQISR